MPVSQRDRLSTDVIVKAPRRHSVGGRVVFCLPRSMGARDLDLKTSILGFGGATEIIWGRLARHRH